MRGSACTLHALQFEFAINSVANCKLMRGSALQYKPAITTITNCNLLFLFNLLVPTSGTAAATGSVTVAVVAEPKKATDKENDTSTLGKLQLFCFSLIEIKTYNPKVREMASGFPEKWAVRTRYTKHGPS